MDSRYAEIRRRLAEQDAEVAALIAALRELPPELLVLVPAEVLESLDDACTVPALAGEARPLCHALRG